MPGFIGQFGIQAGFAGFRLGVQTAQNINLDRGCRFKLIISPTLHHMAMQVICVYAHFGVQPAQLCINAAFQSQFRMRHNGSPFILVAL